MPKPTDMEIFKPRRDGMFERRGTWAEVTVGSKIMGPSGRRGDVWEIIDSAVGGAPREPLHTLWFKARSAEGEEATIPPRFMNEKITFLCESPDDPNPLPPTTRASDADSVAALREAFPDAVVLSSVDNTTGEITCPDYNAGQSVGDNRYGREEIEHLRIFHRIDAAGMDVAARTTLHGQAHNPKYPDIGKTGVPHRHVPEDELLKMFG